MWTNTGAIVQPFSGCWAKRGDIMEFRFYGANRVACDVLREMKDCWRSRNFANLRGLIAELQSMFNRMESGLEDKHDLEELAEKRSELKEECKVLEQKKKELEKELKELETTKSGGYSRGPESGPTTE